MSLKRNNMKISRNVEFILLVLIPALLFIAHNLLWLFKVKWYLNLIDGLFIK